jgi:hypothetical protein
MAPPIHRLIEGAVVGTVVDNNDGIARVKTSVRRCRAFAAPFDVPSSQPIR